MSIAWGPIGGVGFGASAAGADLHDAWERLGLRRLGIDEIFAALDAVLGGDDANVTVAAWDDTTWTTMPWSGHRPVLEELTTEEPAGLALPGLAGLGGPERVDHVIGVLQGHLGTILQRRPDSVDPDLPLVALGVDSLIALEMLFVVERELAVRLELDELLLGSEVTLRDISAALEQRLDGAQVGA